MDLSEFDARGFLHVPNFLSLSEIAALSDDFQSYEKPHLLTTLSVSSRSVVHSKLEALMKAVCAETSTNVDAFGEALFMATSAGVNFPWHQDYESFFQYQDHKNYLNVYIPIRKPDPARSNLSVVPFDALRAKEPSLYRDVVERGAIQYNIREGQTSVFDDFNNRDLGLFNWSLEDLAVTPQLSAGDLLLLRGDIIHRTQDASTDRVAVSLRCLNGTAKLSKHWFSRTLSLWGLSTLLNQPHLYRAIFSDLETCAEGTSLRDMPFFKSRIASNWGPFSP